MIQGATYVHTNLIARDWRALAGFYERVFGCVVLAPERDFAGPMLEAGTGVPGASLRGVHLRMPGFDEGGPTLEIFTYSPLAEAVPPQINRPGFGHIAFAVASVPDARAEVLAAGDAIELGRAQIVSVVGKPFDRALRLVTTTTPGIEWNLYLTCPVSTPIHAGDVLLARFWLRCEDSMSGDGFTTFAFESSDESSERIVEFRAGAGG